MASQVTLTLLQGKGANRQTTTFHSTHRVVRPLTSADLELVAHTEENMDNFKLLRFDQYLQIEEPH
jgi:hypothetical protein